VIKKIAENKTFLRQFKVYLDKKSTSGGSPDHIMFPKVFPLLEFFPGGEKVDPIAVIHHELGHTMFYPKGSYNETLLGERKVVIELDNAARILNGNKPRYTYFDADETGGKTVNIINEKEIGDGKMTFDPKDASKLIERTAAQAKIWDIKKK